MKRGKLAGIGIMLFLLFAAITVLESGFEVKAAESREIQMDLTETTDLENHAVKLQSQQGQTGLLWNQNTVDTYRIPFSCVQGLYTIQISYIPTAEEDTDIVASMKIDGETLSEEMEAVELPRRWVAEGDNYIDENGDEYASYLIQQEVLCTESVRDRNGLNAEDLTFQLEEGEHSLELTYLSGTMMMTGITLKPYESLVSYEEYYQKYAGNNSADFYKGDAITIQAEDVSIRSSRDIPCYTHNDSSMTPYTPGQTRINAFGGGYWYEANSSGSWEIDVPQDGFYKISMRVIQNNSGLVSYRQILLDGEVPFQEMEEYAFYYESSFRTETLGGKDPYFFYLEKGKHMLTMRVTVGEMSDSVRRLTELGTSIELTIHDMQMITGTSPDPNFDYELDKKIPGLTEELKGYADELNATADAVTKICVDSPAMTATLYSDAQTLESLADHPEKIPDNISTITTIQGNINDAIATLQSQPLGVDWISLQAPDDEIVEPKSSIWDTARLMASDFLKSFRNDNNSETEKSEKTIDLWISRDKEWGNLLQRMISEEFEPKYGIKVNVNILPSGNTTVVSGASPLLLSVVAGNTPDIALGCDSKTPIELAVRGQLADLSEFSDFNEIAGRFPDTTIDSLSYKGDCYAIPETMDIPVMVYRTDVLEQNDIAIPQTWEELWQYTLPQLSQIDGNFYIGSSDVNMYASFLYQNGGEFYNNSGDCMLNSEAAILAFDQWTKCFVQYNMPQSASFYNEMRTGTLPIGICSLADYMQLLTYAGELTGKLGVAAIPGIEQEDGTIVRYGAGDTTAAVIFKDSTKKEACWTFLKWWTEKDVQSRFASGIEARVGATGRWFSANTEAFLSLSWSNQDKNVLQNWLRWYKNVPNVLGGYYSSRAITNAWTRTVMAGEEARDSIEQSYEEISNQIERKRQEYDSKD